MSQAVVIICNANKPDVQARMAKVVESIARHADVLATGPVSDAAELVKAAPARVIVLGGDGSILDVARNLGQHQIPIVGVNFGKLGYLAEFSFDDLAQHAPAILSDDRLISRRIILQGTISRDGAKPEQLQAVNDLVVLAGPPFRMIELGLLVDGHHLTDVRGDGIVLATPSGSTAHNMSLGGPIIASEVNAIAVTPIAPHSLTHRPLVVSGESVIEVTATATNEGTTIVADGQVPSPFRDGARLVVRRGAHDFLLVRNPAQTGWHTLTQKLKWGQ